MTKKRSNSQNEEEESDSETEEQLFDLDEEQVATLRLVKTTDQALELINSLSNQPQRFEGDPGDLFDRMDEMRQNLQLAWKDVLEENNADSQVDDSSNKKGSKRGLDSKVQNGSNMTEEEYRLAYIDTMTEVMAEPLDAMRQQHEQDQQAASGKTALDMDINLIVDVLQSGIDLLDPDEKMLFLEELQAIVKDENDDDEIKPGQSIHMMRRKELGFDA